MFYANTLEVLISDFLTEFCSCTVIASAMSTHLIIDKLEFPLPVLKVIRNGLLEFHYLKCILLFL